MTANTKIRVAAIVLSLLIFAPHANAAVQTRAELKTRFENGDIPDGQDFKDVIDSALNLVDDGLTTYRIGADSFGHATRLEVGATIDSSITFTPTSNYPALAPNWLGHFGFLPLEFRDATSASHYGFLQLDMASGPLPPPPGAPGPAIFVQYLVYETNAGVPLTTFATAVPEPTSIVVFCCTAIGAFALRRYFVI